jgi:hypothetical protein
LSYVHLQKSTNTDETVEAKVAFERFANANGVKILHYHADNGVFADNKLKAPVASQNQTLTFCGVNAHFQNGLAERHVQELTKHARTMIIHAQERWPSAITANLWPYELRQANDLLNGTPNLHLSGKIPNNVFARTGVAPNPKHWMTFGCPVYVLDDYLQAGNKVNKWTDRARVGIYLGQSPQHARKQVLCFHNSMSGWTQHSKHFEQFTMATYLSLCGSQNAILKPLRRLQSRANRRR